MIFPSCTNYNDFSWDRVGIQKQYQGVQQTGTEYRDWDKLFKIRLLFGFRQSLTKVLLMT